jgi:NADH-quinone oxidoreductase subunit J
MLVGSNLLGVIQILLYTGGTLILFLFSIFLTGDWDYNDLGETFYRPVTAVLIAFFFFLTTSYLISTSETFSNLEANFNLSEITSAQKISSSLFNDWIFVLELSSILLLATIVGCLTLLKFRKEVD